MLFATAFLLHSTYGNTWGMYLHISEQILTLTWSWLSEATEEAYGHDTTGRGQRFPGRFFLVIQTSGAVDGIGFSTENK